MLSQLIEINENVPPEGSGRDSSQPEIQCTTALKAGVTSGNVSAGRTPQSNSFTR